MSKRDGDVAGGEAGARQGLSAVHGVSAGPSSRAATAATPKVNRQSSRTRAVHEQGSTGEMKMDVEPTAGGSTDSSGKAVGDSTEHSSSTPASRRRESTRARKPSSRLLPSPSPPPPRSSSYGSWLKNRESAAKEASNSAVHATSSIVATHKRSASQIEETVIEAAEESVAETNGKRKRRPSTMTKPPSTITQALSAAVPAPAYAAAPSSKVRQSRKSSTPERAGASGAPGVKKTTKKHVKVKAEPKFGPDKDLSRHDEVDMSDNEGQQTNLDIDSSVLREGHPGPGQVWSTKRTLALATALEPPPLISRRGGVKGCISVSRSSSSKSHHLAASLSTPPRSDHWSHDYSSVSIPLLRFKLDNIASRNAADEDDSAAEDEDDFHVAMLDGGKYFDVASDAEEDVPAASIKSSPRASKGYDDSEAEDTPATTPQSPQSICDPSEQCNDSPPVGEEDGAAQDSSSTSSNERASKVVHDAVFAHALEPSSTRPYTHAGSLTLSLPFEEMPLPGDDDGVAIMHTSEGSKKVAAPIKIEEREDVPLASVVDVFAKHEAEVADDLLETGMSASIDNIHRHAALLLSSPHPMSAFASPMLTATAIPHVKQEPSHLALPAMAAIHDDLDDEDADVSRASVPTDYSTDDDMEEAEGLDKAVTNSNPESMCLTELEETWEQGEHGEDNAHRRIDRTQTEARLESSTATRDPRSATANREDTTSKKSKPSPVCKLSRALPQHNSRATRSNKPAIQGRSLRSRA